MKVLILLVALCLTGLNAYAKKASGGNGGSHSVRGHIKKDGTYVQPHRATNPNNTQRDNWTSKPNVNPYTGKQGSKEAKH